MKRDLIHRMPPGPGELRRVAGTGNAIQRPCTR